MAEFDLASQPAASSCRLINFEKIEVIEGIIPGTYFLTVNGTKPCINMEIKLVPLVYVKCPEYWGIEVVGCIPGGICLPVIAPYSVTIPLMGITGSKGIEIIGANKSEQCKVSGGCKETC